MVQPAIQAPVVSVKDPLACVRPIFHAPVPGSYANTSPLPSPFTSRTQPDSGRAATKFWVSADDLTSRYGNPNCRGSLLYVSFEVCSLRLPGLNGSRPPNSDPTSI